MAPAGNERFAFDRASVRTIDKDGHMHVASSVISAAQVNGYRGGEIPNFEELGMDRDRIYNLLRDPGELEKAAQSFHGKPLLIVHKPQTANDHQREIVVGSVSNPVWDGEKLRAELTVWDAEGISGIEDGSLRDLSCGYRYRADMTPGTYYGERYDGVMRDLSGNHVALVPDGRVTGAFVGDSAIQPTKETATMAKAPLSRQALLASGALSAYLRPRLAQDAKVEFAPLLTGITGKNWKAKRPELAAAVTKATAGKLAQDADVGDIVQMLDQLEEMADDPDTAVDEETETEEEKKARMEKRAADKAAKDAEMAEKDKKDKKDDKPAMDAALEKVKADTIAHMRAVQKAERDVKPYIGEVVAQDSAADVYRLALDHLGVSYEGVHESALPAILKAYPVPSGKKDDIAMDAAGAEARLMKQFPGMRPLVRS